MLQKKLRQAAAAMLPRRAAAFSPVVMRSSDMAKSTMAIPGTNAAPTSFFCNPFNTAWPRSSAPSRAAMTTMPKAIMMT